MFWHDKTKVRKKCCKRLFFLPRRFHWHVISCDCQTLPYYSAILRLGNSRITKTSCLKKKRWKKKKKKPCNWYPLANHQIGSWITGRKLIVVARCVANPYNYVHQKVWGAFIIAWMAKSLSLRHDLPWLTLFCSIFVSYVATSVGTSYS